MTTRKATAHRYGNTVAAVLCAVVLSGCATPGPLHIYSLPRNDAAQIIDGGAAVVAEVPSFLAPGDRLTGFAYDPFTDHFFLRLAPGNAIRVVDRPARAIKREFVVPTLPSSGQGGDLAIRPRDGHVFFLRPDQPAVIETTRLGIFVREFPLAETEQPASGIAYDAGKDRLFVLQAGTGTQVTVHDMSGRRLRVITLDHAVHGSLGFDTDHRVLFAPAAETSDRLDTFNEDGRRIEDIPLRAEFVDVGPRSFIRVF